MDGEEEQLRYLDAEKQAFGNSWSLNFLKWMKAPKEWGTFTTEALWDSLDIFDFLSSTGLFAGFLPIIVGAMIGF